MAHSDKIEEVWDKMVKYSPPKRWLDDVQLKCKCDATFLYENDITQPCPPFFAQD